MEIKGICVSKNLDESVMFVNRTCQREYHKLGYFLSRHRFNLLRCILSFVAFREALRSIIKMKLILILPSFNSM